MPKKDDFVHLHVHSDHSSLDGCGTVKSYMEECAKRKSPAIAFTEHGSMRSFYDAHVNGEKTSVKPIYGIEFYVAQDMHRKGLTAEEKEAIGAKAENQKHKKELIKEYEELHGIRDRWHITAWAKDDVGLKNLFKLSTLANKQGFYYKPRIDLDTLCEYNEGVQVATGCLSSPFHERIRRGKRKQAQQDAYKLYETFGERFWIEVQPHKMPEQREANKFGLALQAELETPKLLATQDAHYIGEDDHNTHEVLLCIGTRDKMSNPDRFKFDGTGFHLKTRGEMFRSFRKNHKYMSDKQIKEALDSTMLFAEQSTAQIEIDYHKAILPSIPIPPTCSDEFDYMKQLCLKGFSERLTPEHISRVAAKKNLSFDEMFRIYRSRLKHELKVIRKQNFTKYFLIVEDLYRWVRQQKIMYGPARGSSAGSLVTFLLGITVVDPLEHNLIFERFLNEDRIDLPDIDMDFEKSRRQEILDHLREQYGEERVCQITTVNKLNGRQCLKDVSRVYGVPFSEANEVTNNIIDDKADESTITTALKESKVCQEFDKKYPEVFKHAIKLEGMAKHLGVHAGGVIITPDDLTNYLPIEKRNHHGKEIFISAVDKKALEALGLVKFDILGLKTLTILRETLEFVEKYDGVKFDIYEDLSFTDKKTIKGFTAGDFVGVFQFDTPGAEKLCEKVKFKDFEDIVTLTSMNRPGATRSGLAAQYLDKKVKKKKIDSLHEKVDEIASDSMGVLVYQEHIMRIFSELAGYSLSDADKIRKKISKSAGAEELEKEREGFVQGAIENDIDEEVAEKIMDLVIAFGGYAFNRCLTGDTELTRPGANRYCKNKLTISELFVAQNSKTAWGEKIRAGKQKILQMDDDGRIRPGYVKKVHYNGIAKTYLMRTKGGKRIKATLNHRFFTEDGYKELQHIAPGDLIYCLGEREIDEKKGRRTNRAKGASYKGLSGGKGVPAGEENPAYVDGRTQAFIEAKRVVRKRANGGCEACGRVDPEIRYEFAHVDSLEHFGGDYGKYHSPDNMWFLCNPCHKKFDYEKGERRKAWSKGKPSGLDEVVSIQYDGRSDVYDVEMDTTEHNFIANELVSHNSHAVAYSMISYWCMYLKQHYPLYFYCALLRSEESKEKVQLIVKSAAQRGIDVLPPHVSFSGQNFSVDYEANAIRGSLLDLKSVGQVAARCIEKEAPYRNFKDFVGKIDKRKVNKGVIIALVKAGAFGDMIPNQRWLTEHFDDLWSLLATAKKNKVFKLIQRSAKLPDYTESEKKMIAIKYNPSLNDGNIFEVYEEFIKKHVTVPIAKIGEEGFWETYDENGVYIAGVVLDTKVSKVGDYHTGEELTDAEKKQKNFGARIAKTNIEDISGENARIKFDYDVYEQLQKVVEAPFGTPIIAHCYVSARWKSLKVNFAVNLDVLQQKQEQGSPLNKWEMIVTGQNPILKLHFENEEERHETVANLRFKNCKTRNLFTGLVTNVQEKFDKNGNRMAFFGMIGGDDYFVKVVCFSGAWLPIRKKFLPGNVYKLELEKGRRSRFGRNEIFNGGLIKMLRV